MLKIKIYFRFFCFQRRIKAPVPNRLFYINSLDRSIPIEGVSCEFLLLPCFIKNPVCSSNSVDPVQTPCSVASDLGLLCLPVSLLWDAGNKWVNFKFAGLQWHHVPMPSRDQYWAYLKAQKL